MFFSHLPVRPLLTLCVVSSLLTACANPDALWHIVHAQCVPNQQQHGQAAPCAEVSLGQGEAQGYVVMKDRQGRLQYLLMPTKKVSGIESPWLLTDNAPNYFAYAWQARTFMAEKHGSPIDRTAVALTVNSPHGRSQNQLHIHISCVIPALKTRLNTLQGQISDAWQPLPGGLNGHAYQIRRWSKADLTGINLFKEIATALPQARLAMGDYTLAAVGARFADGREGFYLLADRADIKQGDFASAEGDVQDHNCQVLSQR